MEKASIIVVDDHQIFRESLCFMLGELSNVKVLAEASNGAEFIKLIQSVKPDIVLMDINMPEMNGIEASKMAIQKYPDLKILILSMFGDEEYYNTMIEIGVKGFLLKDADFKELKQAIDSILAGQTFFSQDLLMQLLKSKKEGNAVQLTKREKEILELICKGMSNQDVANQLHISIRTVEKHRSDLLDKTNSVNSISLVIYAIKNNLVSI